MFSFLISKIGQGKVNLLSAVFVLGASTLVNFLLTPFFLEHVGIEGLGTIRIALSIPLYIGLISLALMASFSRFLVININSNNIDEANKVFNTSIALVSSFFIIVIPLSVLLLYSFDVSNKHLYTCMVIYSFITCLSVSFTLPAYAINKQQIYNINKFITLLFQTLFILILFQINADVFYIGISFIIGSIVSLIYSINSFNAFSNGLKLKISYVSKRNILDIYHMSKWVSVESLGIFFLLTIDLILIKHFLSLKEAGEYSILIQVIVAFITIAKTVGGVYAPKILASYANKNPEKIQYLASNSIVFIGLILTIPVSAVVSNTEYILSIWLNYENKVINELLFYGLILLPILLSTSSFPYIFSAYLKVKQPALSTVVIGTLHLITVIILSLFYDFGVWAFLFSLIFFLFVKNIIFTVSYFSIISKRSMTPFLLCFAFISSCLLISISASNLVQGLILNNEALILVASLVISTITASLFYFIYIKKISFYNSSKEKIIPSEL
ncbi:hypothetical protein MHO82_16675 [Vibrio sp. Of7-15]|uniref:hypothetical protein n=1 Tax=Vibrio sp. Of7-15 TaxID=2724879 RepID=UPI001EF2CC1C|nr:hypothetical protein [Vibrio sp. Of7-15]MCG7498504.1 hypothetical protein [Vibrio sp. Of7-15]